MAGQAAALASGYVAPPSFIVDDNRQQVGIASNPMHTTGTSSGPAPGSTGIETGQVTLGTTLTQIVPARAGRVSLVVVAGGTVDAFVGGADLTTSNGVLLPGVRGAALTLDTQAAVNGIVASGSQAVSFVELF